MRWIIYNRVSTKEQEKNWVSLDYQLDSCLKFAKTNSIKVDEKDIFQEVYSGAFFDRPKLSEILKLIKTKEYDCIIVLRRDRLARNVWIFNQIKDLFDSHWVKIFYPEEALTGEEMIDDFMWNTLVWFAQYEKAMIFKRTYGGRRKKSEAGKWTTQIPYGYIKNKEWYLELYEPEVKIIKLIVNLYLKENFSIWKIADYLNENNIKTPTMSEKETSNQKSIAERRKNASWFWIFSTVIRILQNVEKYYNGKYRAFTTQYKKVWDKNIIVWQRDESEVINISIPRIFWDSIWEQIKERRVRNRNHSSKKSFRTYLLKGKLFCDCQEDLRNFVWYTGSKNKNSLVNYRCSMCDKRKASENRRCHNNISGRKIDNLVIETLRDFFLDYNKFYVEYGITSPVNESDVNIIDWYRYEIYKLEEKEKRALDLALDGMIPKDKLKEVQEEVKTGIEKYTNLIHQEYELVYSQYKQWLLDGDVREYVKKLYNYALEYFEESSYEELKKVVDIMIDKVIVPKNKKSPIRIILNVMPGDFDLDKYLDENREYSVEKPYYKEKTQLGFYQVEFSPNLNSGDFKPTDWGDFAFIRLLKEKFHQLFINGALSRIRTHGRPRFAAWRSSNWAMRA